MESHRVQRRLNYTAMALREWNRTSFGFAYEHIKRLEKDLDKVIMDDNGNLEQTFRI